MDSLIRQSYKIALNLPRHTPNEKLLQLGIHNTLAEMMEAHLTAQYERLSGTETGRFILKKAGIQYEGIRAHTLPIPRHVHEHLIVHPLPKNMHPQYDTNRRKARAQKLHERFSVQKDTAHVDVAEHADRDAFSLAVVDHRGSPLASATIDKTKFPEEAEEAAIALAITSTTAKYIISDSKTAIRNFCKGRAHSAAIKILRKISNTRQITLIWVPAHSGHPGNEAAHQFARGFVVNREVRYPSSGRPRSE